MQPLAVFHDHEGFTTLWSNKSFTIIKLRSGVRVLPLVWAAGQGGSAHHRTPAVAYMRSGTGTPSRPRPVDSTLSVSAHSASRDARSDSGSAFSTGHSS